MKMLYQAATERWYVYCPHLAKADGLEVVEVEDNAPAEQIEQDVAADEPATPKRRGRK